jgi:predicted RecA/RadA family phage recombinase
MAQNEICSGKLFEYTVPTGNTVTNGQVVVMGAVLGVATGNAAAGETVVVQVDGVWSLPKLTTPGNVFAQGEIVYYDTTAKKCTTDNTKTKIGYAYRAAVLAATEVAVKLER